MTIAQQLFEAHHAYASVESVLSERLFAIYGDDGFEDFTHDYYDDSIEVYNCKPSTDAYEQLRAMGFRLVWQHPHPSPRGDCKCRQGAVP